MASGFRRWMQYLGLVRREEDSPWAGQSRYDSGSDISARLDADIDQLSARLQALERRLDGDSDPMPGS